MTRFARAKGSKASNLKSPEDSTPWEVMKEHMLKAKKESEDSKKREEAEQQRIENYNNFLKEQKVQKRKATWCDFPEVSKENEKSKKSEINTGNPETKAKKSKKQNKDTNHNNLNLTNNKVNNSNENSNILLDTENEIPNKKKKKKNNKPVITATTDGIQNQDLDTGHPSEENDSTIIQKKKKNRKNKVDKSNETVHNITPPNEQTDNVLNIEIESGKKKKNKQNKKQLSELKNGSSENNKPAQTNNVDGEQANNNNNKKQKKKNGKPERRKPINDKSFQLIINGKEVQLVRFDGFPIMKKDADRLELLKKSMAQKGIPKTEVQRTLKLERRRAEKALARLKRDVCYNCRKGGHNLSDCPELKSNIPNVDAAEGVCFKCGSTEHRQFECKVQRDKEFRFATCFICKESGHIARQCPDNPKGLYPNGGCCKLCGDVTHLRKDCPTVKDKKEDSSIKLKTLYDNNIEDIDNQVKPVAQDTLKKPKKIKF